MHAQDAARGAVTRREMGASSALAAAAMAVPTVPAFPALAGDDLISTCAPPSIRRCAPVSRRHRSPAVALPSTNSAV